MTGHAREAGPLEKVPARASTLGRILAKFGASRRMPHRRAMQEFKKI